LRVREKVSEMTEALWLQRRTSATCVGRIAVSRCARRDAGAVLGRARASVRSAGTGWLVEPSSVFGSDSVPSSKTGLA